MPNDSINEALKEVYALAPNDRVPLDTIQLSHPSLEESIFMVQDRIPWNLTLEDGVTIQTFEPVPFRFTPPAAGENGIQEMAIAIDNIDRRVTDFIDSIGTINAPVEVTYRPYLSDDPTTPQMNPPLLLFLTDISVDAFEVTGRASFTNIVNFKYPTAYYDRQRFPGLA
tara:strand:- start:3328 stop:3834 length:507 start_codon:yes stop_codon:yes gene_type:complete